MVAFASLGHVLGVLPYALLWQAASLAYNALGGGSHFATRCLLMLTGSLAQSAAGWGMAAPMNPIVWRWIRVASLITFVYSNIQDPRDTWGDRMACRRTIPTTHGLLRSRRLLAAIVAISAPIVHAYLVAPMAPSVWTCAYQVVGTAMCWLVAARLVLDGTPGGLQGTYRGYVKHYGLMFLGMLQLPSAGAV